MPRVVPGDVDDDRVVAAAVTAGAGVSVLGDADLLSIGSHGDNAIMTAAQA